MGGTGQEPSVHTPVLSQDYILYSGLVKQSHTATVLYSAKY